MAGRIGLGGGMDRPRDALPEGTKLAGYVIGRVLGRGGFGITYFGYKYLFPEAKVAIKEFLPRGFAMRAAGGETVHATDPGEFELALAGLEAEAWTLKELRHRNVAEVQDFLRLNGTAYLVMKYEDGTSLAERLTREPILSERAILDILPPLLDGIEAVHAKGYLHRDIKPGNIYMRAADGAPVLLDFGAARRALGTRRESRLTLVLTPGFAPPEQYVAGATLGPFTDLYALGATLYRCMTGSVPPEATLRAHAIQRGAGDPMPPIERAAAGRYSASLLVAVRQSLMLDEPTRPQSVAMLRDILGLEAGAISRAGAGTGTIIPDAAGTKEGRATIRARPALATLIGGVFLALPALLPFIFFAPGLWDLNFLLRPYLLAGAAALSAVLIALSPPPVFFGHGALGGGRDLLRQCRGVALAICGFGLAVTSLAVGYVRDPNLRFPDEKDTLYGLLVPLAVLTLLVAIPIALILAGRHRFGRWLAAGASILGPFAVLTWFDWALTDAGHGGWLSEVLTLPISLNGLLLGLFLIGLAAFPLWSRQVRQLRRRKLEPSEHRPERNLAAATAVAAIILIAGANWIPWLPQRPPTAANRAAAPALPAAAGAAAACREGSGWRAGCVFRDCPDCPEMVVIPAGPLKMGRPPSEYEVIEPAAPQHDVTLAKPFALGKYEVTFAEWEACMATGSCSYRPDDNGWGRARRPVINVSWDDAKDYVAWLSRKTGRTYRLPSEAEWEYAARAGRTMPFSTGVSISRQQANFEAERTLPVGSFPPNAFGLHDMHGNVLEWVEDCSHVSYVGAPGDGRPWTEGGICSERATRGGAFWSHPAELRADHRMWWPRQTRRVELGFRMARTLE